MLVTPACFLPTFSLGVERRGGLIHLFVRFYPRRSSEQAVVTDSVAPSPPSARAFISMALRVQHSSALLVDFHPFFSYIGGRFDISGNMRFVAPLLHCSCLSKAL